MRIFALLFLVGCAFGSQSEWRWETGKEHVFEYSGRMLTGLPQLASHYSGIGLNATVIVEVIQSPQRLRLRLERPRFVKISERLQPRNSMDGPDGANWREVFLPEMQEVNQEYAQILRKPIELELNQGEIKQAKIVRDDPEWSVNLKKALAVLFQTKMDSSAWQQSNVQDNQVSSFEGQHFWKTKEENIDGLCEVTYQVNELPKYMLQDRPELVPYPELCHGNGQKYFEVTKTKDVNTCEKYAAFSYYKPGHFDCNGANCKDMWARTAETRYIACGSRPGNLVIQSIVNQGELNQNVMGFKTERFVTGTLQVLRLREVRPSPAAHQPFPSNSVNVKSMMYEYSSKAYREQQQHGNSLSQEEQNLDAPALPRHLIHDPQEVAKTLPRTFLAGLSKPVDQEIPKTKIVAQIKELLTKVVKETLNPVQEQVEEKQITMKMFSVSRAMSILSRSEMDQVYSQLKSELSGNNKHQQTLQSLFYDAALMTGTPEAVFFLKEKFESGEMTKTQAMSLFTWMPQSLVMPTEKVLETLMQWVQLPRTNECPYLKNVAMMAFTTVLEKSCLSPNRATSYPTWVWGKFCQPDSPFVMEKWVPYLFKELKQQQSWSKKNEVILALGMIPHKDIIGKLIPYIEGRNPDGHEPVPQMTRLIALWSVATAGELEPQTIEPMMYSVYANPSEETEMRIAAFNVLIKLNPEMTTFHKIAARTWTEVDREVLKTVNTAIYTLSRDQVAEVEEQNQMSLTRKAYLTWPLIKKVKGILPTTASIYSVESLKRLGVGYAGLVSWTSSNASFIPKDMYREITFFLERYQFTPLQFGLRQEGIENLYHRFAEIITPLKNGQSAEEEKQKMAQKIKDSLNSEWKKVIEQLGLESESQIQGSHQSEPEPEISSCSVCKWSMTKLNKIIKGTTPTDVKQGLEKLCSFAPWGLGKICRRFVDSYANDIANFVSAGVHPSQVCQKIGMCNSVQQYEETDLSEMYKNLNVYNGQRSRENSKLSGAAFLRFFESTPLFVNFEHMTVEVLREKLSPYLESGNPKRQELKTKLCGREIPFTTSKAIELAPFEATIPMDMGLPLNMISRLPVVFSLQGSIKLNCDLANPGFELKTSVFYNSQYNVQIGTIVPFTKEYAVTAVDQTVVVNVPARFDVSLNLPQQHLKIKAKLYPHMERPVVDLVHFHVHPYTAHQKINDFTPIVLTNKKLIESEDQYKKKDTTFGEYIGLSLQSEIRTESRYTDLKAVFDKLSSFNYNPLNMARFSWAFFAQDKNAQPSIRRHEGSLRYMPAQSTTKEIMMDLKVGYASKAKESEPIKYHKIELDQTLAEQRASQEQDPIQKAIKKAFAPLTIKSQPLEQKQMHPKRQEKIEEVIRAGGLQDVHSANAVVIKYSTTLIGSRTKSWSYFVTLTSGQRPQPSQRKIESKWNLQLESTQTGAKIESQGKLDIPVLPIWSAEKLRSSLIDFRFYNNLKVTPERSSSTWEINVEGNAKTSHEQKEFSRKSEAAKQCAKQTQEQSHNSGENKKVELGKLSEACEAARREAATLDEVDFSVKYVNVPQKVHWYERVIVEKIKALFWPFLRADNSQGQQIQMQSGSSLQSYPVLVRVLFHRETPSFDLIINRANPQEKVVFNKIRMPYPLNTMFPLKGGINNLKHFAQKVTGQSLYPVCKIDSQTVQTFDNRSMPFHIDYCYHLLSGDCSSHKSYAVLTRNMKPDNRRQLKVILGGNNFVFTPSEKPNGQSFVSHMKIEVDQQEVTIPSGKWVTVETTQGQKIANLFRSPNNVIQFRANNANLELTFDGEHITIETSQIMKQKVCGICGNLNNQITDEMQGPEKCIFSKPEIEIASYRVKGMPSNCEAQQPLSSQIKQKLESEKQECVQPQHIPTKITKSLETQVGQCTMFKHAVIRRPGQVCISKKPVIQCSAGCKAAGELVKKSVPFTCMPADRVAEHYAQKANRGQKLQELESHPSEFQTKVPQPRSCVPSTREL